MSTTRESRSGPRRFFAGLWRWTKRIALFAVVLVVVARLTLPWWLPRLVHSTLESRELQASWNDLDLSLLGLNANVTGLRIAPLGAAEDEVPLASIDDVGFDVDVSALIRGDRHVHRVEVSGVEAWLHRGPDGTWNFERHFASGSEETEFSEDEVEAAPEQGADEREPSSIDFRSPVTIGSFAVHGVRVHLNDELAEPRLETTLELDAVVEGIGSDERPASLELTARAEDVLDVLRIEGEAELGVAELQLDLDGRVDGLGVGRLSPYLESWGIRPAADELNGRFAVDANLVPAERIANSTDPMPLSGEIALSSIELDADGGERLLVDDLAVTIERATSAEVRIESVTLERLDAGATRLEDGTLRVLGLDLVGAPSSADAEDEEPATDDEGAGEERLSLRIANVDLHEIRFTFRDRAIASEPVETTLMARANVSPIEIGSKSPAPLDVSVFAALEGAGALTLEGTVDAFSEKKSASLELRATDLTLASVEPYLAAAGLESAFGGGELTLAIEATTTPAADENGNEITAVDASVRDVAVLNGAGEELASIEAFTLDGARIASEGEVEIDRVALDGAHLPIELADGGGVRGFGIASAGFAPRESNRFVGLRDAELSATDLAFGGAGSKGTLEGRMELIGIARSIELDGTIETRPGPLDADLMLTLSGDGVRYDGLRDVLEASGIEPAMQDGSLELHVEAAARATSSGATRARASLERFVLRNAEEVLARVEGLEVEDAVIEDARTEIGSITLASAAVPVARAEDGTLLALGLRIGGAAPGAESAAARSTSTAPASGEPTNAPATGAAAESDGNGAGTDPTTSSTFALRSLVLDDVSVPWRDEAVTPSVESALRLTAELEGLEISGGELAPLVARVRASVDGAVDVVELEGSGHVGEGGSRAELVFRARGFRPGTLEPYLPPELEVLYEDGRLHATASVTADPHEDGGQKVLAAWDEFDLRDGEGGEPLMRFDALEFEAPRIDTSANVFDVERFVLRGLEFDVEKKSDEDGSGTRYEALGVAFTMDDAPEDIAGAPRGAEPEDTEVNAGGAPDSDDVSSSGIADTGTAAQAAPSRPEPALPTMLEEPPTIRLGTLDLAIDRLRYIDTTRENAVPLDLSLALTTPKPQVLCRPDPLELPPIEFAVEGTMSPLAETIALEVTAEPYAAEPGASILARIGGIDGEELSATDPSIAESVDLSAYRGGSVELETDLRLTVARRGPVDIDFSRAFGATFSAAPFAIRPTPGAEPTGFERLDVVVRRIDPDTGDIDIESIDLLGIEADFEQRTDGLHVAGLRFPSEPASGDPAPGKTSETRGGASEESVLEELADEPIGAADDESGEDADIAGPTVSVEQITIAGVDVGYVDTTVEPALRLPITDAQVEVRRFSTKTFTESRPFTFRAIVDAGKVELRERTPADYLLLGVLGTVADVATGSGEDYETEERRAWDLLEITGRLAVGPDLRGRVQTTLLGLELPAFRGPALAGGVEIGDGLVDHRSKIVFRQDGGLVLDTKTTASYLSLSEPADGPISRYLSLPAPLDTVLYLLRNDEGNQVLPIRVTVSEDGFTASQIASLVGRALSKLIQDAVSGAPQRVLGPLADVAGVLGLTSDPVTADTATLTFERGAATLVTARVEADEDSTEAETDPGEDPVTAIGDALRQNPELRVVVQATLGSGDLEVAQRLANPGTEAVEALIERQRDRKRRVERNRARTAAKVRSALAVGALDRASDLQSDLQELEMERRKIELALDGLFARIRPGAERRAELRTRNAAIALAQERQRRVKKRLLEIAGPAAAQRVDVRRPRYESPDEDDALPEFGTVTLTPK